VVAVLSVGTSEFGIGLWLAQIVGVLGLALYGPTDHAPHDQVRRIVIRRIVIRRIVVRRTASVAFPALIRFSSPSKL
jgi:hypothetical protein